MPFRIKCHKSTHPKDSMKHILPTDIFISQEPCFLEGGGAIFAISLKMDAVLHFNKQSPTPDDALYQDW